MKVIWNKTPYEIKSIDPKKTYNLNEAAAILRVTNNTVKNYIKRWKIPGMDIPMKKYSKYLVKWSDIILYFQKMYWK